MPTKPEGGISPLDMSDLAEMMIVNQIQRQEDLVKYFTVSSFIQSFNITIIILSRVLSIAAINAKHIFANHE